MTTEAGCRAEVEERGYPTNSSFAGNSGYAPGCHIYDSNAYGGRAYFGTGGTDDEKLDYLCSPHIRVGGCGEDVERGWCEGDPIPEPACDERDLTTEEGCKAEVIERGLTWNAEG
jgi:hypothetical protein